MVSALSGSVIILRLNSLEIIKIDSSAKLELFDLINKNQEIIDQDKFSSACKEFFRENVFKDKKSVLILDRNLIYKNSFKFNKPEEAQEQFDKFFGSLPVALEELSVLKLYGENSLSVLAVKKALFMPVVKAATDAGWKIEGALPVTAFSGLEAQDSLPREAFLEILAGLEKVKYQNFLNPDIKTTAPSRFTRINPKRLSPLVFSAIVILLLLITGGIMVSFRTTFFKNEPDYIIGKTKLIPTEQPTARYSSIPVELKKLEKSDLKIRILNGSGKAGEAGKVKSILDELGFKTIETGNTDKKEQGGSLVYIDGKVPDDLSSEVVEAVKKSLGSVVEHATSSGEVDVLVIIRKS